MLKGVQFFRCTIIKSRYIGCDLEDASFEGSMMRDVYFENCHMVSTSFRNTTLRNVRTKNCQIIGIDLTGADMDDISRFHLSG
jgi:uncharacterized protein YjbI with pentapeptide repeats